jgi:hypothetical protein
MSEERRAIKFWSGSTDAGASSSNQSSPPIFFSTAQSRGSSESSSAIENRARDEINMYKEQLGFLDRVGATRQTKAEIRRVYGQLVVNLLEKQKEKIIFALTIDLDQAKKRIFQESLKEGGRMEQEITRRSIEFEEALYDIMFEASEKSLDKKEARMSRLEARRRSGMDDRDYDYEFNAIGHWQRQFRDNLEARVTLLLRNHAQQVERALALFHENHLGRGI